MKFTKDEAIDIVTQCAKQYQSELEKKVLLFICQDKHKHYTKYEFAFFGYNYMHLTGLKTKQGISAVQFYNKCLAGKLSTEDFDLSQDGTTQLKLEILPSLMKKNLSASMVGKLDAYTSRLYTEKLAGNIQACMGFVLDGTSKQYVPNTILKEDIRKITLSYERVIAVYRRDLKEKCYEELVYLAKGVFRSDVDKLK